MADEVSPQYPSAVREQQASSGWAVGLILAVLSAIANFLFIPYYPFWALLIIALDVFVVWALAAHSRDVRDVPAWTG